MPLPDSSSSLTGHELKSLAPRSKFQLEHVGHPPFVAALQLVGKVTRPNSLELKLELAAVELTAAFTEILVVELRCAV